MLSSVVMCLRSCLVHSKESNLERSAAEIAAGYRILTSEGTDFASTASKAWANPSDGQAQSDRVSATKPGPSDLLALDRLIAWHMDDATPGPDNAYKKGLMDREYVSRAFLNGVLSFKKFCKVFRHISIFCQFPALCAMCMQANKLRSQ